MAGGHRPQRRSNRAHTKESNKEESMAENSGPAEGIKGVVEDAKGKAKEAAGP